MADDEHKGDPASDPWGDILGGEANDPAADPGFSFTESLDPAPPATEARAVEPPAEAAPPPALAAEAADRFDDGQVGAWLEEAAAAATEPAHAASSFDPPPAGEEWGEIGFASAEQPAASAPDAGVSAAEDAALVGGAAAVAPRPAAKKPAGRKKSGGIGQMIGVMLGGAMAIPITLGILIWGFQKDPFKVTKHVPESVAFLLPPKFQPGARKPVVSRPRGGSPLDALGTGSGSPADAPGDDGGQDVAEDPAADGELVVSAPLEEPLVPPADEPPMDDVAVAPTADGETFEDSLAAAVAPPPVAPPPALDEAPAKAAAGAADRRPLDAAVESALAAAAALEAAGDAENPARKKRLVDLYKALATVGAELVTLERILADAGQPLAERPPALTELQRRLPARDELVRLGRNWIDYAKRSSDGVVLPVTFQSARKVGPYWSSKVTIPLATDGVRELVVLSRAEPAAIAGDDLLLTGMLFEGDVIWAADVRVLPPGGSGSGDEGF